MALTPAAAATQPPSNDVTKEVTVPRRRQLPVVQNFVITPVVTRDHQPGETQPRNSRADLWCRPQTINKPRERDPALITLLQCFQLQWHFSENSTHGKMENWNARQIFFKMFFTCFLMLKLRGWVHMKTHHKFQNFSHIHVSFQGHTRSKTMKTLTSHSWVEIQRKEFTQTPKEEMQIHRYLRHKYPTFYSLCF